MPFGYRVVRESDWTALQERLTKLEDARIALLRELNEQTATARSASTFKDLLITEVNQTRVEMANLKLKETGQPQQVAQIGKSSAAKNAMLEVGADIFSDVGDAEAERLKALGMLHDDEPPIVEELPSAAELSADAVPR